MPAFEMATTQEELEMIDSYNEDILPPPERRFTVTNLFRPLCTEPTPQSGFVVSVCTCVLGERFIQLGGQWISRFPRRHRRLNPSLPPGVLVFVFSIVAVHGGLQTWSLSVLSVILGVCVILTVVVWRQPQSKARLVFKVDGLLPLFHTPINTLTGN